MDTHKVRAVFFSPTGTSKALAEKVAEGIGAKEIIIEDVTKRKTRKEIKFGDEIVIFAAPVYYGRLPVEISPYFKKLKGNKNPVVLIAVYGNREYDDALVEFYDIADSTGFIPFACGAFVAEHSYSTLYPIAEGRPDKSDLDKALEFGSLIAEKLKKTASIDKLPEKMVPGNRPYVELLGLKKMNETKKVVPMTPETDKELCIDCKMCVDACPNNAIDYDDVSVIDRWNCMLCFACVKICPQYAKGISVSAFDEMIKGIADRCKVRKEPEWFL